MGNDFGMTLRDKVDGGQEVTQEMREKVEASLARAKTSDEDVSTLIGGEIRAKYKIEVTFTEGRTMKGPNLLGIQVWESGKRFNGGGDEICFFCKDSESDAGCWSVIPSNNVKGGVAYCPGCERAVNATRLVNMKIGRVTTQNLAKEVAELFRKLNSSADIYLKFHTTDIRYIAMERAKGPDVARRLKGMHIYPLKNLLKDTSNGADLGSRIFAFLTS
jgi:hypothetical protein